jgi:hypothetical protein
MRWILALAIAIGAGLSDADAGFFVRRSACSSGVSASACGSAQTARVRVIQRVRVRGFARCGN